jgi:hypothetical protein
MVGDFYDEARGFDKFRPTKKQKEQLLDFFDGCCAFCGRTMTPANFSQDHLVPMNKERLGLHAWGNVIPAGKECNGEKLHDSWKKFLTKKSRGQTLEGRMKRIESFVEEMRYDPDLGLDDFAGNLYQDVGEVAMTLITLRYHQAQDVIRNSLEKE